MHIGVLQSAPPPLVARLLCGLQETREGETLGADKEGGPFQNYLDLILSNIYKLGALKRYKTPVLVCDGLSGRE